MNAVASFATKAVVFTVLGTSLCGCALGVGIAALGAGASFVAIDHSTRAGAVMSAAPVQSVENSATKLDVASAQEVR